MPDPQAIVVGAGLAGCAAALAIAGRGHEVLLLDRAARPMRGASLHNEGKLHLGYVYAAAAPATHAVLARGSLRFVEDVAALAGVPPEAVARSRPFAYLVPPDSRIGADAAAAHVLAVDGVARAQAEALDRPAPPPSAPIPRAAWRGRFAPDLLAAFATPEVAVDPARVSDLVTAAVMAHPRIAFHGGREVVGATRTGPHTVLETRGAAGRATLKAPVAVNAAWENQPHLDAAFGHPVPSGWSRRWKATVVYDFRTPPDLPSVTAVLGAYGDVVLYESGRLYLSWYPACRIGMDPVDPARAVASGTPQVDGPEMAERVIAGLETLVPRVRVLRPRPDRTRRAFVGGGWIMAQGRTDIDDGGSGLHQRDAIGVTATEGWVSISTGKFCTAPMFGRAAADAACEMLA